MTNEQMTPSETEPTDDQTTPTPGTDGLADTADSGWETTTDRTCSRRET